MSKGLGSALLVGTLTTIAACDGYNNAEQSSPDVRMVMVHQMRDSISSAGTPKSSDPKDMPGKDMGFFDCVPTVKDEINSRNGYKGNEELVTTAAIAICAKQRGMWVSIGKGGRR